MPLRLVAVDMDGSFLDDDMSYDRPRFARVHAALRERGIRFVVASGNQYVQLRSFFPGRDDIIYVAENGALIMEGSTELLATGFADGDVRALIDVAEGTPGVHAVVCGARAAYAAHSADSSFVADMRRYYHRMEMVASLHDVDDLVLKLALATPADDTVRIAEVLRQALDGIAVPVSSGHGSIDLIQPGVHKGSALARLGAALDIDPADMIAFGDGGNDVEMLRYVGCGVAMANAPEHVRAHADAVTASNNESGVLAFLERILADEDGQPAPAAG